MLIPTPDRISFTSRYQIFIRETGKSLSYEDYLLEYELTERDKSLYLPYLSPFIRKRNQIAKLLKDTYQANVMRVMRKQIKLGNLPEEYLVFMREYPKKH